METAKERVLKAINHVRPDTTPVHIMGFEALERWLQHFHARDAFDLRDILGLDIRMAPPIYTGPNAKIMPRNVLSSRLTDLSHYLAW